MLFIAFPRIHLQEIVNMDIIKDSYEKEDLLLNWVPKRMLNDEYEESVNLRKLNAETTGDFNF